MRTGRPWAAMALAVLALARPAQAQVAPVVVTLQRLYDVESIFAGDFAPYGGGQQPDFLGITLNSVVAQQVTLELVIRQERPRSAQLFRGTTNRFALATGVRRITNRDLANQRSDVVIDDYDISGDTDELTDQVLESGRFPAGSYLFQVILRNAAGIVVGTGDLRLELMNPSRIELLTPGRPFGDTPELVTTSAPRFQWTADASRAGVGRYRIRVAPADGAGSPEEAMQAFPSWEETTSATTALYPGSVSAIPLVPGQTYAWQVTREVRTSSGSQFIDSPIFWFKLAGEGSGDGGSGRRGGNIGASVQLELLARALGLGGELEGFTPTGQLTVDGKPGSVENLEALLRAILAGEVTVHSVDVR